MTEKTGTVDLPIIVDWENRPRQKICHENGRQAVTDWRLLRTKNGESRVRLMPKNWTIPPVAAAYAGVGSPDIGRSVLC